ncbi:MAG TPA: energy-coupling factor transporter transmembrane component T [Bacteroidales bacterium]
MQSRIPSYLLQSGNENFQPGNTKRSKLSFLDRTILNSANAVKSIYLQGENGAKDGLIQKINPHIKLISLIYMAVVISFVNEVTSQIILTIFIFSGYLVARLKILEVYRKIFFLAFIFGFLVVFPASLNVISPGKIIFNLISFNKPSHFWIYNIPENVGFTENGIKVVTLIFLRVLNSVSFAFLVVYTTPFPSFIKSFKIIGVPDTFLMIITLAYKFIFILSRTIEETYFALKSRLNGNIRDSALRKLISGRVFFIFKKAATIYENTYFAMVSRGYNGSVKLHSQYHFNLMDFVALTIVFAVGLIVLLFYPA